jgi:hypothetical protein
VNAAKQRYGSADLAELFRNAARILVAKGKTVREIDVAATAPTPAELASLVLGPTGNLRAPAIRVGSTWLIGFHEPTYADRLR